MGIITQVDTVTYVTQVVELALDQTPSSVLLVFL